MMKPARLISLALVLSLGGVVAACKQEKAPPADMASEAAAPEAKPGLSLSAGKLVLPAVKGNPGAAYFVLHNGADKAASLVSVAINGAGKTEMHETKGGTMVAVVTVEAKPGETVAFERGGRHVMAFDLDDTLKAGGTAEATLTFADGDKLSAPLTIEAAGGEEQHGSEHAEEHGEDHGEMR